MKLLKQIIIVMIVVMSLFVGDIINSGYTLYRNATVDDTMMTTIDEIREQPYYIQLEDISTVFLEAIVSIEDHRFYHHEGYDLISIGRSVVSNLKAGEIVSGGSTITQQLAKNIFLSFEQEYDRKIAEVFIAIDLEDALSKNEILELYVNVIYFGESQYGILNASNHYFNKTANDLTRAEAIMLAGLPQSPRNFGLSDNLDSAKLRSEMVLQAMVDTETIHIKDQEMIRNELSNIGSLK